MNDLLLSEINSEQNDLLKPLTLVEEYIFSTPSTDTTALNNIVDACNDAIADVDEAMMRAEHLINELYVQHLFLDNPRQVWPVLSHQIESAVGYKIMAPVAKAALTCSGLEIPKPITPGAALNSFNLATK